MFGLIYIWQLFFKVVSNQTSSFTCVAPYRLHFALLYQLQLVSVVAVFTLSSTRKLTMHKIKP